MGFFAEYKQVNKLLQQKQEVVFYAESRHYHPYFEKLINDLLVKNVPICYITSDAADPLLKSQGQMKVIYVKWLLGFLFSKIKASVLIMTMPDLGNFLFKRSPGVGTYVYMFHAAVSTHQQYRKAAFNNYDAVFCTGRYQEQEIRLAEKLYNKKQKELIPYGYPLLDEIKNKNAPVNKKLTLLIAPSWFEGCIFDICIEELLQQLSGLPYSVILRSHPEYEKRKKKKFRTIQKLVSRYPDMSVDTMPNVIDRLPSTDVLITDRSGIALEFAFGTGRPVLFIETALKTINPNREELNMEPIENKLRSQLGVTVSPSALNQLSEKIGELEKMKREFAERMLQLKKAIFYNGEESYRAGLDFVLSKIANR